MTRPRPPIAATVIGVLALTGCAGGADDLTPHERVVVTLPPGPVPSAVPEPGSTQAPTTVADSPGTGAPTDGLDGMFLENNTDHLSAADIQTLLADVEDVAFGYVRARTGVEHTDPTLEVWLERTLPFLTPAYAAELRAVVEAGGGISSGEWAEIQAGRTRRGADPQRIDLWPVQPFNRTRMVVVITYDAWSISATDPVRRATPGTLVDLTLVRGEGGSWLVDGEGEYAVSGLEWG